MSSGWESASREDRLTVIGLLQRQNKELAAANERLTARIAELERRLGRNSVNSSMPPPSDTLGRPVKKPQAKSGASGDVSPVRGAGLAMVAGPMSPRTTCPSPAVAVWQRAGRERQHRLRAPSGPRHSPGHSDGHRAPGAWLPVCERDAHHVRDARGRGRLAVLLQCEPVGPGRPPAGLAARPRGADRAADRGRHRGRDVDRLGDLPPG